jgi:hypothetical protein
MDIKRILNKQWNQNVLESRSWTARNHSSMSISPKPHSKKIRKWLQDLEIMDTNRIPKQALQYKSKGRRNTGRPKKG